MNLKNVIYFSFTLLLAAVISGCIALTEKRYYLIYPVKTGDTLSEISDEFNVSLARLMEANDIDRPEDLQAGSRLMVPVTQAKAKSSGASIVANRSGKGRISSRLVFSFINELEWPLTVNGRISSRFGYRSSKFHEGVDIGADKGTAILAAHKGIVVHSGNSMRGYGNVVIIKGDKILTVYAHNRKNLAESGDSVSKGEKVAEVGSTGRSTGNHLHFETRIRNSKGEWVAVDPMLFFNS